MATTEFPASGTANFETEARAAFNNWRSNITSKAAADHTHDAGSPTFISLVTDSTALSTSLQDGALSIAKDNGNRYTMETTGSKQRVMPGNIYGTLPTTATYKIETGTVCVLATGGVEKNEIFTAAGWVELPNIENALTWTSGQRGEVTTMGTPTSLAWDLDDSNNFSVSLVTSAHTLANPTNPATGQSGFLFATPSTAGMNISAYGGNIKLKNGNTPSLTTTADEVNVFSYVVLNSTNIILMYHGVYS